MDKFDIEQILIQFFEANHCHISKENKGVLEVQLTVELDKALMNRPFYWHYMEATGQIGEPYRLTFLSDPTVEIDHGEWVHIGSPRLHQIMAYLQTSSKYIQLYEQINTNRNTLLQPWLLLNCAIQFKGKQVREELFSIGLNLINGKMVTNMMERLETFSLQPFISDHCYTISPLIKLHSGYLRIEKYLLTHIQQLDDQWVEDSLRLLNEEIAMIEHFYEYDEQELKKKEIEDTIKRLQPTITFHTLNGGLLYLSESFNKKKSSLTKM